MRHLCVVHLELCVFLFDCLLYTPWAELRRGAQRPHYYFEKASEPTLVPTLDLQLYLFMFSFCAPSPPKKTQKNPATPNKEEKKIEKQKIKLFSLGGRLKQNTNCSTLDMFLQSKILVMSVLPFYRWPTASSSCFLPFFFHQLLRSVKAYEVILNSFLSVCRFHSYLWMDAMLEVMKRSCECTVMAS